MGHSVFSEGQGSLVTLGKKNESSEARKSRAKGTSIKNVGILLEGRGSQIPMLQDIRR